MALDTSISTGPPANGIPVVKEAFQEALAAVQHGYRAMVQMKGNVGYGGPNPTVVDLPVDVDVDAGTTDAEMGGALR
jgi:ribosomal protein L6P/L9E